MSILKKDRRQMNISDEVWKTIASKLYEVADRVAGRAFYEGGVVKGREILKHGGKPKTVEDISTMLKDERLIKGLRIDDRIIFVKDSFEGEILKPAMKPRCHFLAGVLAALCSAYFGEDVKVEETDCVAMGKKECRFVVKELEWYEKMKEIMEVI